MYFTSLDIISCFWTALDSLAFVGSLINGMVYLITPAKKAPQYLEDQLKYTNSSFPKPLIIL
jgi:hypothetical protein